MKGFFYLLVALLLISGCIQEPEARVLDVKQEPEARVLDVKPVVDQSFLGGYTGKGAEGLFVLAGDISNVRKSLEELLTGESPPSTFDEDDAINFVVFRGVFRTGGYGVGIESVERTGNDFMIRATYIDPGESTMVIQAFTQPTAIVPIGKLARGSYQVRLVMTRVSRTRGGDVIVGEEERARVGFEVR